MNFNTKYHPITFIPKLILGKTLFPFFNSAYKTGDLLVLNYHSTPEWLITNFEKQLQFYSKYFTFLSPQELDHYFDDKKNHQFNSKGPFLVFTFDDGLKNNLYAARVLEKFNTRGLFFIIPKFYQSDIKSQPDYYQTYIRYQINKNMDYKTEDVTAMDEADLKDLIKKGHMLGSHSLTHTMKNSDSDTKIIDEIEKSKYEIEKMSGSDVKHFCSPFQSLSSTGVKQMQTIKNNYKFFHSTFPGSNSSSLQPYFIRRTNVECHWPIDVIKFAISKFEWSRYQKLSKAFNDTVVNIRPAK